MSVPSSSARYKPWLAQITLLSIVMGGLLALSLKTQDHIRNDQMPSMRPNLVASAYAEMRKENLDLRKQVTQQRKQIQKYQDAMTEEGSQTRVLAEDLRKLNVLAGLTPVTGPGVIVILRDSKKPPQKPKSMPDDLWQSGTAEYLIHDSNIRDVINELKNAGAEAISVNDQRVINTTSVRCVGNNVHVNAVPTAGSPVIIKAIGNADLIQSGLLMRGGIKDQFVDPEMIVVDKADSLTLPAYSGATPLQYAKPAPEQKGDQAQRQSEEATKSMGGTQ